MKLLLCVVPALLLLPLPSRGQSCSGLADAYGNKEVDILKNRLQLASGQREKLEVIYRLYPLTEDENLLSDLPASAESPDSATELALLAALWTWKGDRSNIFNRIPRIMKGVKMLDRAKEINPDNPLTLLIDGQALIFKPGIAGGSVSKALDTFERLHSLLVERPVCEVAVYEVESWIWYCLHRMEDPQADAYRDEFLASDPPPLFRDFVRSPL